MPELPDITLYVKRLQERLVGQPLERFRIFSPFLLRSVGLMPSEFEGKVVQDVYRLGKRLVLEFENEHCVVLHLMIAGRLQWQEPVPPEKKSFGKVMLAAWRFPNGQLILVELSTRKRAAVYLAHGREGLSEHRRSGLDVFTCEPAQFERVVSAQNRTLKRILTDPASFDGIGNAYSDEILFRARLSPVRRGSSLTSEELDRLRVAAQETLGFWTAKLQSLYPGFPRPGDITAFRPEFAVHGRYREPCPACGAPIQHIVYSENETNYCARCQNEGRLLADRSLSRLLKEDWPKTLEEMEDGNP